MSFLKVVTMTMALVFSVYAHAQEPQDPNVWEYTYDLRTSAAYRIIAAMQKFGDSVSIPAAETIYDCKREEKPSVYGYGAICVLKNLKLQGKRASYSLTPKSCGTFSPQLCIGASVIRWSLVGEQSTHNGQPVDCNNHYDLDTVDLMGRWSQIGSMQSFFVVSNAKTGEHLFDISLPYPAWTVSDYRTPGACPLRCGGCGTSRLFN